LLLKEVEKLYYEGAMDVFYKGSGNIEWRQKDGKPECEIVSWSSLENFEKVLPDFWEKKKKTSGTRTRRASCIRWSEQENPAMLEPAELQGCECRKEEDAKQ